jgi:hypothetical protein
MSIYDRISEGLSGASKAYMRMERDNRKMSNTLKNSDTGSEDRNKKYNKIHKNELDQLKVHKAIPQKNVRKKYRATRKYDLDKSNSKALRFFRKEGI